MAQVLSEMARDPGIDYFLISFMDLFGVQRSKRVPAQSIGTMAADGPGFTMPGCFTMRSTRREAVLKRFAHLLDTAA